MRRNIFLERISFSFETFRPNFLNFLNLENVFQLDLHRAVQPNIFLERNSYSFEIFRPNFSDFFHLEKVFQLDLHRAVQPNIFLERNSYRFEIFSPIFSVFFNLEKFFNLTFIGPCIVIYFYHKTNQILQFFKFILFWNKNVVIPK